MAVPTVTVACKLPHGIIMRLFNMVDHDEAQSGGGYKTVKRAQPTGDMHVIKGYLSHLRGSSIQHPSPDSSYAFTDVPKDFWDKWLLQNGQLAAVKNGLIFAMDKAPDANAKAREMGELRCGLEPVDRSRLPKGITTADAA